MKKSLLTRLAEFTHMRPWILAHALEVRPELFARTVVLAWVWHATWLAVLDDF